MRPAPTLAARVRSDCARGARPTATKPRYPRVISRCAPRSACSDPSPSRAPLRSQDACGSTTFPLVFHRRSAVHRAACAATSRTACRCALPKNVGLRDLARSHRNSRRPRAGQVVHGAPRCLPGAYQELRAVCARDVRRLTVLPRAPRPPQVQHQPHQAKPRRAKSSRAKSRPQPSQAQRTQANSSQANSSSSPPSQVHSSQVHSSQVHSSQVKPSQARAKPSQAKPGQVKPSQAKPSQAKPSQVKPSQAKSSQASHQQHQQHQQHPVGRVYRPNFQACI